MEELKTPPIGLRPRQIVDAHRLEEIFDALRRYYLDHKAIPIEWIEEFNEITKRVEKWQKEKQQQLQNQQQ